MARHKDQNWNLPDGTPNPKGGATHTYASIQTALLMDIRDELKALNRTLNCSNFQDLPRVLRQIRANTTTIKNEVKRNGE